MLDIKLHHDCGRATGYTGRRDRHPRDAYVSARPSHSAKQRTLAEVSILELALQVLRLLCSRMGAPAELPRDSQQEKDSAVQYNVDVQVTIVSASVT